MHLFPCTLVVRQSLKPACGPTWLFCPGHYFCEKTNKNGGWSGWDGLWGGIVQCCLPFLALNVMTSLSLSVLAAWYRVGLLNVRACLYVGDVSHD